MRKAEVNPERAALTRLLRKEARARKVKLWRRVAELLEKAKRRRIAVNLSTINRHTERGDQVVVPGKTLSAGLLTHPVTVAAFSFSAKARKKIEEAGGKCLKLEEMLSINPEGKKVKLLA
ncbi:50S ribosomal protein L18e [Candidatus Hecatella orcuttiae]|uniref:50S ribosomal protein L18e n=1 Tax=Candidatus Hecatella orcuttiae TaxID=1935119 RepID=UPI002867B24F|nr:50S ribosomal protein L18e [Candidatus Hecatella orcuttiae]